MIGFYDYTVVLTYLSLLSATTGIVITLNDGGHPYLGIFFLLICGLCDAFDGKVARGKKNRTEEEKKFGIQIDSLSDLVAFGVLPTCIGISMLEISPYFNTTLHLNESLILKIILYSILIFYSLAALIRLAYFNVTEEIRQEKETTNRKTYTGLPVTSASLIFPTILLLQYLVTIDITPIYLFATIITGVSFLLKFEIKKPEFKKVLFLCFIGAIEFFLLIFLKFWK